MVTKFIKQFCCLVVALAQRSFSTTLFYYLFVNLFLLFTVFSSEGKSLCTCGTGRNAVESHKALVKGTACKCNMLKVI